MNKSRIEALTDGIFAVVMTLTVLEFKVPEDGNLFSPNVLLMLLIYITTFVALASIWNSLHHVMTFIKSNKVDELILWSNHWILLIVCLFPFSTVAHCLSLSLFNCCTRRTSKLFDCKFSLCFNLFNSLD